MPLQAAWGGFCWEVFSLASGMKDPIKSYEYSIDNTVPRIDFVNLYIMLQSCERSSKSIHYVTIL